MAHRLDPRLSYRQTACVPSSFVEADNREIEHKIAARREWEKYPENREHYAEQGACNYYDN